MQRLAASLARLGVTPNAISIASMAAAVGSFAALLASPHVESGWTQRGLWLLAAATIQLRLLCNMIDGMVAIEGGKRSPVGELYNEAPDRVSDSLTLIGAGYAVGSNPELGYIAALLAMMTAYVRALGKGAGAGNDFGGPMAKPHRMMTLTAACLAMAAAPDALATLAGVGLVSITLGVIAAGSALTCVLRLRRIAAALRRAQPINGSKA